MEGPIKNTLNPTCTGTSVLAIQYDKGVVVCTDRVVSYGKTARYHNCSRQYKVNDNVIIAFSGDHADFQWLQNLIERQVAEWDAVGQDINPKALHGFLTSLLYSMRSRMSPLWNNLIVAGVEEDFETKSPFIGVITPKGVAYTVKSVATGIGAMLLNQLIEDEYRKKGGALSLTDAQAVMRKALELTIYHDCTADNNFELGVVDFDSGATVGGEYSQERVIGDWAIAEANCQYE